MNYAEWIKDFEKGKRFISQTDQTAEALHTVRRYMSGDEKIWETGITYTGRVVIRQGIVGTNGITIQWTPWETKHEIITSKSE